MDKTEFLNNTLFPLLRAGLELEVGNVSNEIDYQQLISIGKKHSILPIIRQGLKSIGKIDEGYQLIDKQCQVDVYQFVLRDNALKNIYKCFEKNSIKFIPLKGSILRNLYPEKWIRTSCDIDILVKEEDLNRAIDALKKETGFKHEKRHYHDVSMMLQNIHLELHFSIKEDMDNIDKFLSDAWNYVQEIPGSYQCSFTKEFQLFHIIAHMAYHFVHGGLGVRSYIDLWLYRHKEQFDEQVVKKMCGESRILKFYDECCKLSEVWFGFMPHTNITKALEEFSIDGGLFGNDKNRNLSMKRNKTGIKYYLSRIFISNKTLKEMYPKAKKYPILLVYYQFRRWIQALTGSRKKVANEIKEIQKITNSEIETYDQLLKSVGM